MRPMKRLPGFSLDGVFCAAAQFQVPMGEANKAKRKQTSDGGNAKSVVSPVWKRFSLTILAFTLGAVSIWAVLVLPARSALTTVRPASSRQPSSFRELLALTPQQLAQCDIALMNLLCAEGLPGAESLSVEQHLKLLDAWAARVGAETQRNLHRFRENPAEGDNSEAKWRMLMLITVLQQDLQVRYNPGRIEPLDKPSPPDVFFADSRDGLLHGLLGPRRMGTCASMPVLYVAVGRRLGYPLKLVASKGHLFLRWEDSSERFNFEGTNDHGGSFFSDSHYQQWPFPISDQEVQVGYYLRSMNPQDELAAFLEKARGGSRRCAPVS